MKQLLDNIVDIPAHLYPRHGSTLEWDTGTAQAVVNAAGGQVTNLYQEPLQYNKENLLNPYFMVAGKPAYNINL